MEISDQGMPTSWQGQKLKVLALPRQSGNPYITLLYEAVEQSGVVVTGGGIKEIVTGNHDIVHYHWPESFLNGHHWRSRWYGFQRFMLFVLVTKLRHKKIVWTMHNVEGHEESGRLLPRLFRMVLFWATDGLIALSAASYHIMVEQYPGLRSKPFLLSWIGNYRVLYPNPPTKAEAKEELGVANERVIIGYFGTIRPYKNVPHLMRVFKQFSDPQATLLLVGSCPEAPLHRELLELARNDPRVELRLSFLPERELPLLLRAVDLMALPFHTILNSSSALLALSLDIPLLVPAKGSLVEMAEVVGPEWVRTYPAELTVQVLADAVAWARTPRLTCAPLELYDWARCGRETANFYRTVAQNRRAQKVAHAGAE